jgi:hypothetical protein
MDLRGRFEIRNLLRGKFPHPLPLAKKLSSWCSMTNEEFLAELETLDVGVVKERIASDVYPQPWKGLARGWIDRKEAELSAELMALAHQAHKDAQMSNWIALAALVIAAVSLIVAVFK